MAKKMAIPPIKEVGFLCQRSLDGLATHPLFRAVQRTIGVSVAERPKDNIKKDMKEEFIIY